jgi:hypothetical protein
MICTTFFCATDCFTKIYGGNIPAYGSGAGQLLLALERIIC